MLTSADQYRYINASSVADYITGDIMPVRDTRGDDSWKILKYEDPIFLKEAYLERMNWVRGPGNPSDPPLRRVHATDMNGFRLLDIRSPNSGDTMYITADSLDSLLAHGIVMNTPGSDLTTEFLTQELGRLGLKPVRFQPVVFQSGGPLPADDIRKMYHNVRLARASLFTRRETGVFGYMSYIEKHYTWGDRDPVYPDDVSGFSKDVIYRARQLAAMLETNVYFEFRYPSEGPTIGGFGNLSDSYATRAVLFVGFEGFRESDWTTRHAVLAMPCTIQESSPGSLTVKAPPISQYVPQIVQKFGIPYVTSAQQLGSSKGGEVRLGSAMLALVHDFPSDFDDRDWGWTPPA
jgi:hypothetical protein